MEYGGVSESICDQCGELLDDFTCPNGCAIINPCEICGSADDNHCNGDLDIFEDEDA